MRESFFRVLLDMAERHEDIYLLTADMGFKLFDSFRERCPDRFLNIGIAEANMIGIAAGLSLSGKNVYCYSIIPFLIMRAYEQIRVDVACQNLNVKLVGVGGGFTYGLEGFTHFGIEDLSLMRSLPNMSVVIPADVRESEKLAGISYEHPSPLYIRLGRAGEPLIHTNTPSFEIGKGLVLVEGKDVAIFATGSMVYQAVRAIDIIRKKGLSVTLVNMHTLKPLDVSLIKQCASTHRAIFTVEEHTVVGGLGSAVAEVLAESSYGGIFRRIGIPESLKNFVGDASYLKEKYGLTAKGIAELIMRITQKEPVWSGG